MKSNWLQKSLLLSALCFSASQVYADWQLEADQSHIHFVSIKKAQVGEVHTFKQLSGSIDESGKAAITIQLDSVETQVPIRNERMRDMLFETARFPSAQLTTAVDTAVLNKLKPGQVVHQDAKIEVALHGKTTSLSAELQITGLQKGQFSVVTAKPVVLYVGDFDLAVGVKKLQEVAKLPSISLAVPGTVNLVFSKK